MEVIKGMVSLATEMPPEVNMPQAVNLSIMPQYPYGTQLCLNSQTLEKLDLPDDCKVGDSIVFECRAKVTSTSDSDTGGRRVELQITHIGVDDDEDEDDAPKNPSASKMYK